jgi:hypothetical protein
LNSQKLPQGNPHRKLRKRPQNELYKFMVHPLHRRRQALQQIEADKVKAEEAAAKAVKKPVAKKKTTKKAKTDR